MSVVPAVAINGNVVDANSPKIAEIAPNATDNSDKSYKKSANPNANRHIIRNENGKRVAAVLVPIIQRMPVPTLIYTQRSSNLPSHPGQISFPGGCVETDDANLTATALREAQEEIGLDPKLVEIVTLLPEIETPSGFAITPVVGLVDPSARLSLNHSEVAAMFEVPLPFLLTLHHQYLLGDTAEMGISRMFEFAWESWRIWGATARISYSLIENIIKFYPNSGDHNQMAMSLKNLNLQEWRQISLTALSEYQPKRDKPPPRG